MNFVVFGLSISSAWGNGHATLLRGLFRALHAQGHVIHFFERDVPYYARHRDAADLSYAHLHLYREWADIDVEVRRLLDRADVGLVTSYCPHGKAASRLVFDSGVERTIFYDLDTPVTLQRLDRGESVDYLPEGGLSQFDLVLSYTGGAALERLQITLGARNVAPLYGWVDPTIHYRRPVSDEFKSDIAYLGTFAADREAGFDQLLLEPARRLPNCRFLVAGAMYPDQDLWPRNVRLKEHVAPPEHGAFYSSSPLMLSLTRESMARSGYCPSGRLFESAACETAVLSDWWEGLDSFFTPGQEILVASSTEEAIATFTQDRSALKKIGQRAKERALDCHTADHRAKTLLQLLDRSRTHEPDLAVQSVAGSLS